MAKTLTEVIGEQGFETLESGSGRRVMKCPFHKGDHEPSLTIYPTETYFCFACDAWGDAVKFLVDLKGWTSQEALDYVGADYKTPKADKTKVIKVRNTLATFRFLHDVAMEYHEFLRATPGALNYLHNRGLNIDTIRKYKIGYTDGHVLRLQTAYEMDLALEIGLINKSSYEMLSHRVTIPNITEEGQCDFMMGRTVINDKVKYLGARMPKPIQGFYEIRHSPVIFLVEGQFDWLTLRQWGYPAAVISGTHLSRANKQLLEGKKIVIVPDYDDTNVGINAANGLKESLGENAVVLDYGELKTGPGKLDISSLAESKGGEFLFQTIVREQLPWLTMNFSRRVLSRYFPSLVDTIHSVSI
jgi:DNA primase